MFVTEKSVPVKSKRKTRATSHLTCQRRKVFQKNLKGCVTVAWKESGLCEPEESRKNKKSHQDLKTAQSRVDWLNGQTGNEVKVLRA